MQQNSKLNLQNTAQRLIILLGVIFLLTTNSINAQFIKTNGTKFEDSQGDEIFLTGINLGNWLLWEGYLMMGDFNYRTHTQFFNSVKDAFGNNLGKAIEFEHQWRLNYVTETTISDLKKLGYNSVRVPFHYNLFWDYNTNSVSDRGFQYIDNLIKYCSTHGVYILLDMHAAPGYQNPGDHCDNQNSNANQPRESVGFWNRRNIATASKVWRHIAKRYKDEPTIWGYDLINEPVPQPRREYELLPSLIKMRNAIRRVDKNHIIVAEGSWWGSDFEKINWLNTEVQAKTGINSRWDDNLVYQTHHYSNDVSLLDGRLKICNDLNIPLLLGEYGESDLSNIRNMTDWCLNNNVSYFPWSFKKVSHDKCLWTIHANDAFKDLRSFINNGGNPPANIYTDMIHFCKNNIANEASSLTYHNDFYLAVKNTNISGCEINKTLLIPAQIEAEDYCDMRGVQTEKSSDINGGENIGWVDDNDWLKYDINIPKSGKYLIEYRVSSPNDNGVISINADKRSKSYGKIKLPNTGGWQSWKTISHAIKLQQGPQSIYIKAQKGGWNFNWFRISKYRNQRIATNLNHIENAKGKISIVTKNNQLQINGANEKSTYSIYSISGEMLKNGNGNTLQLNGLRNGMYIIEVKSENEKNRLKFLKK